MTNGTKDRENSLLASRIVIDLFGPLIDISILPAFRNVPNARYLTEAELAGALNKRWYHKFFPWEKRKILLTVLAGFRILHKHAGLVDHKVLKQLIAATNRELIDDRVGELTLERERLEQRLESLTHLLLSKEESEEIIAETARFVAALKSSLTNQPLDQRQGAIRRCVEQIVVNHKEGECRITFRKIPMIVGGSLVVATRDVEAQLRCAGRP